MGLVSVFIFTGFIGFYVGPVLSVVLQIPHGAESVMMALGSTAVAFCWAQWLCAGLKERLQLYGWFYPDWTMGHDRRDCVRPDI